MQMYREEKPLRGQKGRGGLRERSLHEYTVFEDFVFEHYYFSIEIKALIMWKTIQQ